MGLLALLLLTLGYCFFAIGDGEKFAIMTL
jgi:hypothetical protein